MINNFAGLKLLVSTSAVTLDGTNIVTVNRSFRERFLTLPWKPWVINKEIEVPNYVPAMYKIGNTLVCHPSLEQELRNSL
jgi:hypothetical protein